MTIYSVLVLEPVSVDADDVMTAAPAQVSDAHERDTSSTNIRKQVGQRCNADWEFALTARSWLRRREFQVVRIADVMCEGQSTDNDRIGAVCDSGAQVRFRNRWPQLTGDTYVVSDGELIVGKPSEPVTDAVGQPAWSVRSDVNRRGSQLDARVVSFEGFEYMNMIAHGTYTQEL